MPDFESNNPRDFGWSLEFRGFVPFVYQGFSFPQGVHPLVAHVFTTALQRLTAAGLRWPAPSVGLAAGMWGQESRSISGSSIPSFHAYGLALDVLAPWNPSGAANPSPSRYRLPDNTSALVEPLGILWGGSPRFGNHPDRMHLEVHLSTYECGEALMPGTGGSRPAFPLPSGYWYGPLAGPAQSISGSYRTDGPYRPGLARAQTALGVSADGYYGPLTAAAARAWQAHHGLEVDGLIGAQTWASLFPA